MQSPLKERLGLCGTKDVVQYLLQGSISSIDGVHDPTMEVLKFLALKEGTPHMNTPPPIM